MTTNDEPLGIGLEGVITSLFAGHGVPFFEFCCDELVDVSCGLQAGGSGFAFGPPTGFSCDA